MSDPKKTLVAYLERLNGDVLHKVDGLGEYDLRRPMTPTGTNLLGVVKHLANVQAEYFGLVFGRPFPGELADPEVVQDDMYARADEPSASVLDLYRRSWEHAQETCAALDLDAPGEVPWWGDHQDVTLHQILVHMAVETARHAGHLDIVREAIDGQAGRSAGDPNLDDAFDWPAYVARLEKIALDASSR